MNSTYKNKRGCIKENAIQGRRSVNGFSAVIAWCAILFLSFCILSSFAYANQDSDLRELYSQDPKAALKLAEPLATQGNAEAQYIMGMLYSFGDTIIPLDKAEGIKWWRKAAKQGNIAALNALAHQKNVDVDVFPTVQKMAEMGRVDAAVLLGMIYAEGLGIKADASMAVKWFRKAANQGDYVAQRWLASAYQRGDYGVPIDNEEAYFWWLIADKTNSESKTHQVWSTGRFKGDTHKLLSKEQINKVEEKAHKWKSGSLAKDRF